MTRSTHYDAIIIGAGQSGGPLSTALARAGRKTALVEREHVGGTCINVGCTPTKTMIASARAAYLARRGADFGVHTGPITVDLLRVRQRKRDIVSSWRDGSRRRIEGTDGVDLLDGEARFVGPKELEVRLNRGETRRISADVIVINTGTRPATPRIEGLDRVSVLNSTTIMELDEIPEHLIVLGGGYVGLEFGQMFRRFGSRVTIVQRSNQLLAREDADVADTVASILREDGIDIMLNSEARRVTRVINGALEITSNSHFADNESRDTHKQAKYAEAMRHVPHWLTRSDDNGRAVTHGFSKMRIAGRSRCARRMSSVA